MLNLPKTQSTNTSLRGKKKITVNLSNSQSIICALTTTTTTKLKIKSFQLRSGKFFNKLNTFSKIRLVKRFFYLLVMILMCVKKYIKYF